MSKPVQNCSNCWKLLQNINLLSSEAKKIIPELKALEERCERLEAENASLVEELENCRDHILELTSSHTDRISELTEELAKSKSNESLLLFKINQLERDNYSLTVENKNHETEINRIWMENDELIIQKEILMKKLIEMPEDRADLISNFNYEESNAKLHQANPEENLARSTDNTQENQRDSMATPERAQGNRLSTNSSNSKAAQQTVDFVKSLVENLKQLKQQEKELAETKIAYLEKELNKAISIEKNIVEGNEEI